MYLGLPPVLAPWEAAKSHFHLVFVAMKARNTLVLNES